MRNLLLAALAMFVTGGNAAAQLTRGSLRYHLQEQVDNNQRIRFPRLAPSATSKIGHVGELSRSIEDNRSILIRVLQQIDEGTLVMIEHHTHTRHNPAALKGSLADIEARQRAQGFGSASAGASQGRQVAAGPFLIKSPDSKNIPDGGIFEPHGLWEITSLFRYEAALGNTKTVLVIEPIPPGEIEIPEPSQPRIPAEPRPPYRKWTSKSGDFEHVGIYKGFGKGVVIITDEPGIEHALPFADLPAEQQEWVRKRYLADKRGR